MTKPQIIYQDDEPAFVVLPYAEWLATIDEDEADEIAAQQARDDDDGTRYPMEVITRLSDGESPIRVYRDFHELTKVYIGQLERGERNMSPKLRAKIAIILDVENDDLTPWAQD
mgnify:CR=1 FL=1